MPAEATAAAVRSGPLLGTLLRGSKDFGKRRRLAKEDKNQDVNKNDQAEDQTDKPTPLPTVAPTVAPSLFPNASAALTSNVTETPTGAPSLSGNERALWPFSIRVGGSLSDEGILRRDLELYLAGAMKETLPFVQSVLLTPAAWSRRSLQEATLLRYNGVAIMAPGSGGITGEAVREAQLMALEATSGLSSYLDEFSSQPLALLRVAVADFPPVDLTSSDDPDLSSLDPSVLEKSSSAPVGVGAVVGLVAISALVGLACWHRRRKLPPPPPTYHTDPAYGSKKDLGESDGEDELPLNTTLETADSDGVRSPGKSPMSPSTPPPSLQFSPADDGPAVALQFSLEDGGVVERFVDEPQIDLTRPAKNPHGMSAQYESPLPARVVAKPQIDLTQPAKNPHGMPREYESPRPPIRVESPPPSPPPPPPPRDVVDGETTPFNLEVRTMDSNKDGEESMEGYSLATDAQSAVRAAEDDDEEEAEVPYTPPPPDPVIEVETTKDSPLAGAGNHPVMRWFGDTTLPQPRSALSDGFFYSDSESNPVSEDSGHKRLVDVAGLAGLGKESEVSQEVLHGIEAVSEYSEECASSYKEEDSGVDSSVLSYISSDMDPYNGLDTGPGFTNGALGYFHREQEEDVYDLLPRMAQSREVDYASDAPSDERHTDRFAEQDLHGFGGSALDAGLIGFLPPEEEPPAHDVPQGVPEVGSWEENPEAIEVWVQERRRIRRQARAKREERKQPPLTMEV